MMFESFDHFQLLTLHKSLDSLHNFEFFITTVNEMKMKEQWNSIA